MNNQKIIIFSLISILFLSFFYLAYIENEQHEIENQWFLYFQNPKDSSLSFVIENHTEKKNFHWKIELNGETVSEKDVEVSGKKIINIENIYSGKNTIIVSTSKNNKKIYKILK